MIAAALSNELKSLLTRSGADDPSGDAALIIEAVTGLSHMELILNRDVEITPEAHERAVEMARRRASGEPIQYIIGKWTFMGNEYRVGRGVLIPRDDTEVVVRAALDLMRAVPSPAVVDLCAGSGIIAVTLSKKLKGARVSAVEKSAEAFAYLKRNVDLNGADVELINADLCDCADGFEDRSLDLIISNPPYVKRGEIADLQREVRHEPSMALDGGESGTEFYDLIVRLWTPKLKRGGMIAFELGEGQYGYVAELLKSSGYADIKGCPDIQGITRAVTAKLTF